jgi:hypothetical protein
VTVKKSKRNRFPKIGEENYYFSIKVGSENGRRLKEE